MPETMTAPLSSQAPLAPATLLLLQKMRKGGFASLTEKSFRALCADVLQDWSVSKHMAYLPSGDLSAFSQFIGVRYLLTQFDHADRSNAARRAYGYSADDLERERQAVLLVAAEGLPDASDRSAPAFVVSDVASIMVEEVRTASYEEPRLLPTFRFSLYAKAAVLRITAPNGLSFDLSKERTLGPTFQADFTQFGAWAASHTDLLAQVNALLGTEPHVGAKDRVRLEENIGTCGICSKRFKIRPDAGDVLVNHGYERPGIGYLLGQCFGVGYQPYELSRTACVEFRTAMTTLQAERTLLRQALADGQTTSLFITRRKAQVIIRAGELGWESAKAATLAQMASELSMIASDIVLLTERVDGWVAKPQAIRRSGT
jgi:hypothetical protein